MKTPNAQNNAKVESQQKPKQFLIMIYTCIYGIYIYINVDIYMYINLSDEKY